MLKNNILYLLLLVMAVGCKDGKDKAEEDFSNVKGTYFSVKQFAADQWNTYHGMPFLVDKTVTVNGNVDSAKVSSLEMDWGSVLQVFFAADISDRKFLGKYDFSLIEDATTSTRTYYYEAKDEELFTKTLQVITDNLTNKVKGIFIETRKDGFWKSRSQKLYYAPMKSIQIQEFEDPLPGDPKEVIIEYRFLM